jgi:hypothetical protein
MATRQRSGPGTLAVLIAAVLIAGCGSGPSASPASVATAPVVTASAAPAPGPATAPPASSAAPQASAATPETSGSQSATPSASSGVHGAPELEALLPDLFGTLRLEKGSVVGASAVGNDATGTVITQFLAARGHTIADLAVAQASDPSGTADITFVAFRVTGVDAPALLQAILEATKASDPEVVVSLITIGGRQVTRVDAATRIRVLYLKDGVVFGISAGSQELLDQALTVMP